VLQFPASLRGWKARVLRWFRRVAVGCNSHICNAIGHKRVPLQVPRSSPEFPTHSNVRTNPENLLLHAFSKNLKNKNRSMRHRLRFRTHSYIRPSRHLRHFSPGLRFIWFFKLYPLRSNDRFSLSPSLGRATRLHFVPFGGSQPIRRAPPSQTLA
jgi:hypothetical protein